MRIVFIISTIFFSFTFGAASSTIYNKLHKPDFKELCEPSITSLEYELKTCYAAQDKVIGLCNSLKAFQELGLD